MMQGQTPPAGPPSQEGTEQQQLMQFEDTIAGILDDNPEMKQNIHQALQEATDQGAFDDMSPEDMQEMLSMIQQIVEDPQSYPQIYQQIVDSGGNPSDFPPPNSPIEQVQEFAAGIMVVLFYIAKLGQQGGQPPQGGMPPQGGQPPQGGMPPQGFADGGMVGMTGYPDGLAGYAYGGVVEAPQSGEISGEYTGDFTDPEMQQRNLLNSNPNASMDAANKQNRRNFGAQQVLDYQNRVQAAELDYQNRVQAAEDLRISNAERGIVPGVGQLMNANQPEYAKAWIGQRLQDWENYGSGSSFKGYDTAAGKKNKGRYIRGDWYTNDPAIQAQMAASYNTNPYGGKTVDDIYGDIKKINVARFSGGNGAFSGGQDWRPMNQGNPDIYWSPQGSGYENFKAPGQAGSVRTIRGQSYGSRGMADSSPWVSNWGGAFTGQRQSAVDHAWKPEGSDRLYPVRNQAQLDAYTQETPDYTSGMYSWEGGNPNQFDDGSGKQNLTSRNIFRRDYDPTYVAGTYPGLASGGMVGAPEQPMQTNTGDDQLIAAKTGEGVLNVDAVNMLGGPTAVNQLNYQASGQIPGGQPVTQMGGMQGYNYGGIVSDRLPAAISGFSRGGIVGAPQPTTITDMGWVWSEPDQKYVEVSRTTKRFSGRVLKAMSFWGVFKPFAMAIVAVAAIALTGGAATPVVMGSTMLGGALVGAAIGAIGGAALTAISGGGWKDILKSGAIGAIGGAITGGRGGYFSTPSTAMGGSGGLTSGMGPKQIPTGFGGGATSVAGYGGYSGIPINSSSIYTGAPVDAGQGPLLGGTLDPYASGVVGVGGQNPNAPVVGNTGTGYQNMGVLNSASLNPNAGSSDTTIASGAGMGERVLGNLEGGVSAVGGGLKSVGKGVVDYTGDVLNNITGQITDPKTMSSALLRGGQSFVGGMLSEDPKFSNAALLAGQEQALGNKSALLNLQRKQYEKNAVPLQDDATAIARMSANPQGMASQSQNAFKLQTKQQLDEQKRRLAMAGYRPGSPAYEAAMRKSENARSLGGTQAYNTGYQRGVESGTSNLANAKGMQDMPDYSQLAGQYSTANYNQAATAEREWEAGNTAADKAGKLFFPTDREDEINKAKGMYT